MTPYQRIIKAPPSTDIEVWIDPRTKEPCRRCDGTGKMQPWPGSKGLVVCGVCRAEIRPLPNPLSPQEERTKGNYDPECEKLARYFLPDYAHAWLIEQLSEDLQNTSEDFLRTYIDDEAAK